MAKTRKDKEADVEKLVELLKTQRGAVFASVGGVTVKDMTKLRRELREAGVTFFVPKKTLLKRALEGTDVKGVPVESFFQAFAIAASQEDEVAPAKLLAVFQKEHETMQFLGGILDRAFVSREKVKELAKLPGKQELRGQLVGTIAAPMTGFLGVLQGTLRSLVGVLHAYQEKKATS